MMFAADVGGLALMCKSVFADGWLWFAPYQASKRRHTTHIVTSTQTPVWNRKFDLSDGVYSAVSVSVIDKHAAREEAEIGVVTFR